MNCPQCQIDTNPKWVDAGKSAIEGRHRAIGNLVSDYNKEVVEKNIFIKDMIDIIEEAKDNLDKEWTTSGADSVKNKIYQNCNSISAIEFDVIGNPITIKYSGGV